MRPRARETRYSARGGSIAGQPPEEVGGADDHGLGRPHLARGLVRVPQGQVAQRQLVPVGVARGSPGETLQDGDGLFGGGLGLAGLTQAHAQGAQVGQAERLAGAEVGLGRPVSGASLRKTSSASSKCPTASAGEPTSRVSTPSR